jgi:hypothetical protein
MFEEGAVCCWYKTRMVMMTMATTMVVGDDEYLGCAADSFVKVT